MKQTSFFFLFSANLSFGYVIHVIHARMHFAINALADAFWLMHFSLDMSSRPRTYRSKNCKNCVNCLRDNCGSCLNCTNPKRKQKCIFRTCLYPEPEKVENNIIYETNDIPIEPAYFQPKTLKELTITFFRKKVNNFSVKCCGDPEKMVKLLSDIIRQEKSFSPDSLCDANHAF